MSVTIDKDLLEQIWSSGALNPRPPHIYIREVENGWTIDYWGEDKEKHTLVCVDQFEVMYYLHKFLCPPPPPPRTPNKALYRGPFR